MKNTSYIPRLIDSEIEMYLSAFGAVCIEGPKLCGKTSSGVFHSKSQYYVASPINNFQNRKLAEINPFIVLEGEFPRLVDDWQEVPALWDAVRIIVDESQMKGQFILTGSIKPKRKGVYHSGTGRIAKIRMNTMSLYELGKSSGDVSLKDLFDNNFSPKLTGDVSLHSLIDFILRGGWPGSRDLPLEAAMLVPKQYIKSVLDDDIFRLDDVARSSHKMGLLLASLARNESTTATNKTLINDIKEKDEEDIHPTTVADYLEVLTKLFIIENQKPFGLGVRSSLRIKQAEKRHITDTSLACALLKLTPTKLLNDLETFGFLFESLCEHDLRVYAQSLGGELYHYQDYKNNEIDAIVELPSGEWGAFEIKLGANQIDKAAENLLKIKNDIVANSDSQGPKFLAVICGMSNAVYQREDGVYVIPITALKN